MLFKNSSIKTHYDSANLSGHASIAHSMHKDGRWGLEVVNHKEIIIHDAQIIVQDGGEASAVVDMAQPFKSCACSTVEYYLAPGGMLNLNAGRSFQGDYALLKDPNTGEVIWDSRQLEAGDYYACMLLRPGMYRVVNLIEETASSIIKVNYPDPRSIIEGRRRARDVVHLSAGHSIFPEKLFIDMGQLLVFTIESKSHLSVMLEEPDDGPSDLPEWRERHSKHVLELAFSKKSKEIKSAAQ